MDLLAERKIEKKLMLKAKEEKNALKAVFHDNNQKTKKEFANSLYGIAGEAHSYIFNPYCAISTTASAFVVTTSAVVGFESLFGNFRLRDNTKLVLFVSRILNEKVRYKKLLSKLTEYFIKKYGNEFTDKVLERLNQIPYDTSDEEAYGLVKNMIENATDEQKALLLIKNNLEFFMNLPRIIKKYLVDFTGDYFLKVEPFLEGSFKEEDKEYYYQEKLNKFYDIISDLVFHMYTYDSRKDFVLHRNRKYILTIDTDSTFIFTGWFRDLMMKKFDLPDTKENKLSVSNVITFICSKFIRSYIDLAIGKTNLKDEDIKRIAMKNEFFIERIVLTKNKKQYITKTVAQEGVILRNKETGEISPEIEYKGLQLKKSTISEGSRNILVEIIEKNIFASNDINLANFISDLIGIRKVIDKAIEEGSTKYCELSNFGEKYKFPERMQVVRGAKLWNFFYPENPILISSKCLKFPLTGLETLKDWEEKIKPKSEKVYNLIKKKWFDDPVLGSYAIDVICLPWGEESIPKWLRPYIDSKRLTDIIIRLIVAILPSLNIKVLKVKTDQFLSNLIEF